MLPRARRLCGTRPEEYLVTKCARGSMSVVAFTHRKTRRSGKTRGALERSSERCRAVP